VYLGNIYEQLLGKKSDGAQAYYFNLFDTYAQQLAGFTASTGRYVTRASVQDCCTRVLLLLLLMLAVSPFAVLSSTALLMQTDTVCIAGMHYGRILHPLHACIHIHTHTYIYTYIYMYLTLVYLSSELTT
jgi:hypothetical protein